MDFAKFLRTPFFTEHLWWLLLILFKLKILKKTQKSLKNEWLCWSFMMIARNGNGYAEIFLALYGILDPITRMINVTHEPITRTGITCKEIPCYKHDSAYRWFIVKKAKIV